MYSDTFREDRWVNRLLELTQANTLLWRETARFPVELRNLVANNKLGFVATVPALNPDKGEDFRVRIFLAQAPTTDVQRMEVHTYGAKFDVFPSPEVFGQLFQAVSKQVFRHKAKVLSDNPEEQFETALGLL